MSSKPIFIILGIVHSKLTKHVAPHLLDENLAATIKTALQKIGEGIQQLKLKDLMVSQNILECIIVRLKNKFGEECSQSSIETLGAEIERDLKTAQTSAMSGFNSGLGSVEQVTCMKIILMSECFLALNTLSSLQTIASKEHDTFKVRLKSAREICSMELQKLNAINEVSEYLANKLAPGVKQKRISVRRASSLGKGKDRTKADLAREVIAINFFVRLFFYHWDEKLSSGKGEKKKGTLKSGKMGAVIKGLDVMGPVGTQGACPEARARILAGYDFLFVGAAFSVIKQDEELAQLIESYILDLDSVEQTICMEYLKKYLPMNKGVQKAVGKRRSSSDKKTKKWTRVLSKKEKEDEPDIKSKVNETRYLDVLNRLCAPSVIDNYLSQTTCGVDGSTSVVPESGVNIVPTPISGVSLQWKGKPAKSF